MFVDFPPKCVVVAKRILHRTGPAQETASHQLHVNWCRRHECGEENIDWEVVPIPNKGLGIRAQKLLPAGMKIIVEPVFTSSKDYSGITSYECKIISLF